MKYSFTFILFFGAILFQSCDQLGNLPEFGSLPGTGEGTPSLTNDEVIAGLKEALRRGADLAASKASAVDGFYKNELLYIAFPEEAAVVKEKAIELGLQSQVDKFELTLNRAAEEAAKEAAPVFLNAIKGMTLEDGFRILNGSDTEATQFLKERTTAELISKFEPKVSAAIDKVELTKYWEPLVNAYNTATIFTGGEEINTDLQDYVTTRAIDGLFIHIATEEKNIRENPQARVTELLRRVFGS